tara:strand:- start:268 stop:456 length:189 start_codon:yes stop_codon:yes gene_type:complete
MTGSLGSASLQFVFPALFALLLGWSTLKIHEKGLYSLYLMIGVIGGILGFVETMIDIVDLYF